MRQFKFLPSCARVSALSSASRPVRSAGEGDPSAMLAVVSLAKTRGPIGQGTNKWEFSRGAKRHLGIYSPCSPSKTWGLACGATLLNATYFGLRRLPLLAIASTACRSKKFVFSTPPFAVVFWHLSVKGRLFAQTVGNVHFRY